MIYLDYAATTPMSERALTAYTDTATTYYGNPSSLHDAGTSAHTIVELCRKKLAASLGVKEGIYFTSGGTESNQLGITTLALAQKEKGRHIITSRGEHASVHSALSYLVHDHGFEVTELKFTSEGEVDLEELAHHLRDDTVLVSFQHINSENGVIQPIQHIAEMIKGRDILFHSDFVQSFGKIRLDEVIEHVDAVSISSHKLYGPKGVGLLYIRPSVPVSPLFPVVTQEKGMRGGTINTPGISSFTVAAMDHVESLHSEHYWSLRTIFIHALQEQNVPCTLYEHSLKSKQLPQVVGLRIHGVQGQWMMLELNKRGFAISTGSACHVGLLDKPALIYAMDGTDQEGKEFIRISFGEKTVKSDLLTLANSIKDIYNQYFRLEE
ncbi:hypothetical protein Q73_10145 [Bacillus coahuilensis m2-6]|uniref:IscS subfamily cysteine desulfurase n=1 Tax=Bacillus coahuilensis TaxID=408580 RepID=UPI0007504E8A|nr:IscS subfamily cysteine desulfurase [Bacillus coahuilensis]KUP06949.1 hypothetical protein Q73_10145 [Bacillus coahuilensis m2-6]